MAEFVQVVATAADQDTALSLARSAVECRLAACAETELTAVESVYWRGDRIETAPEWRVVFRTTEQLSASLVAHLVREHPYDPPGVLVFPIAAGDRAYLDWLGEVTARH